MTIQSQNSIFHRYLAMALWQKITLTMLCGIIVGLIMGPKALVLKPIGTLFLNAIHFLIVPVIFTASICAILSMNNLQKIRSIILKIFTVYFISMAIATIIGLLVAGFIMPGHGLAYPLAHSVTPPAAAPSLADAITQVVPTNPISAFLDGNILQILFVAFLLGAAINMAGEKAQPLRNLFEGALPAVLKLTAIIIGFAPYGVFALMACAAGEYGLNTLIPLLKLIVTAYVADILLFILFYALSLALFCKYNPVHFFRKIREALLLAFSSSSSAATLPVSLRCAEDNLGVPKEMAGFALPLGISFNMNGLAIYVSIAVIFTANIYGIHFGVHQYLVLILTIVLTSMGAAGIPGSAMIVMGAVMTAVGLPLGAIALIASVDRIIDMAQTTTNVAGDLFTTFLVAKAFKK